MAFDFSMHALQMLEKLPQDCFVGRCPAAHQAGWWEGTGPGRANRHWHRERRSHSRNAKGEGLSEATDGQGIMVQK
jgi:hypothetical protein